MNRVDGKVAVITGAGSGIGAATARLFSGAGAQVVLTDVNDDGVKTVADEINSAGGTAIALHHDVTSQDDWQSVMDQTMGEFGHLEVLVNNAGVSGAGMGMFEEQTFEQWRTILGINLDAVFLGCQKAVNLMKDSEQGGSIVNISSVMGIVGGAGAAYNASKGGVRLLSKSVAVHCGNMGYNIRCNSVHPGYIWTPMVRNIVDAMPEEANMTEDGLQALLVEKHPIGRLGVADDIAKGILFLASDDSSFMTGSELVIDGGYTAV